VGPTDGLPSTTDDDFSTNLLPLASQVKTKIAAVAAVAAAATTSKGATPAALITKSSLPKVLTVSGSAVQQQQHQNDVASCVASKAPHLVIGGDKQ